MIPYCSKEEDRANFSESSELNKVEGDVVSLETLKAANVVRRDQIRARIVLSGEITRAFTVQGVALTKGAKAAVEAAGGKVEE